MRPWSLKSGPRSSAARSSRFPGPQEKVLSMGSGRSQHTPVSPVGRTGAHCSFRSAPSSHHKSKMAAHMRAPCCKETTYWRHRTYRIRHLGPYRTGLCGPPCCIKGRVLRPYHTGLCKPLCWRGAPGLGPRCWRLPADTGLPTRALVPQSLHERRAGHEEAGNGWADSRLPASRVQRALDPVPAHGLRAQGWLQVDDTGLPPPARVTQSLHERRAEDPVLGREGADARLPPCSQKRGRGTAN